MKETETNVSTDFLYQLALKYEHEKSEFQESPLLVEMKNQREALVEAFKKIRLTDTLSVKKGNTEYSIESSAKGKIIAKVIVKHENGEGSDYGISEITSSFEVLFADNMLYLCDTLNHATTYIIHQRELAFIVGKIIDNQPNTNIYFFERTTPLNSTQAQKDKVARDDKEYNQVLKELKELLTGLDLL